MLRIRTYVAILASVGPHMRFDGMSGTDLNTAKVVCPCGREFWDEDHVELAPEMITTMRSRLQQHMHTRVDNGNECCRPQNHATIDDYVVGATVYVAEMNNKLRWSPYVPAGAKQTSHWQESGRAPSQSNS